MAKWNRGGGGVEQNESAESGVQNEGAESGVQNKGAGDEGGDQHEQRQAADDLHTGAREKECNNKRLLKKQWGTMHKEVGAIRQE